MQLRLYHTGYQEIQHPDVHYGRKNADFGQGFYLTADMDFAVRWAHPRKGKDIFINSYILDLSGLKIHVFQRDVSWFSYLHANRNWQADHLDADVIRGPIANDTIFDTLGIISSGILSKEEAMRLLMIGPAYEQIALKTQAAADHLHWLGSQILHSQDLLAAMETKAKEEESYQKEFAAALGEIEQDEDD